MRAKVAHRLNDITEFRPQLQLKLQDQDAARSIHIDFLFDCVSAYQNLFSHLAMKTAVSYCSLAGIRFDSISCISLYRLRAAWCFWALLQNCDKRILTSYVSPSVCLSVPSSIRTEQLVFHGTDFHEIWYLSIFRKSFEEIQP